MPEAPVFSVFLSVASWGTVKTFSCRVIDRETGLSIVGAKVRASFGNHSIDWNTAGDISLKYATTDADGKCRFTGRTNNDQFGWSVLEAQGYYQADGEYIDFVGPSVMGVGLSRAIGLQTVITYCIMSAFCRSAYGNSQWHILGRRCRGAWFLPHATVVSRGLGPS